MIHDIKDFRRALSSTSRCGLGPQASIYLPCGPWKAEALESETDEKGYVDAARIDRAKLLRYNAEDCVRTAQIRTHHLSERRAFNDRADRERLDRLYSHQLRLAEVAGSMSRRGFPVDESRRRQLAKSLRALARERQRALAKLIRPFARVKIHSKGGGDSFKKTHFRISEEGGVNERDLAALIYKESARPGIKGFDLEVPVGEECRTDGGAPSVNQNSLLFLLVQPGTPPELRAICRAAWEADSPLKALSTFVESKHVLGAIGPDGRMHAGINSCGTETGRWSCSRPNLFNLPEAQEAGESLRGELPNIRQMYYAGEPGWVIVHRDWKQLELEMMATVTGDTALRRMLDTGDAHTARVHEWFGLPKDQPVPKMVRRQGKVVGFASQYAAGIAVVFIQVLRQVPEASWDDIAALHAAFPEKHPGIAAHWEDSLAFAMQHGYNETAIMQRRRYYPPDARMTPTETSNYEIQGTAADIANCTMVGIDKKRAHKALYYQLKRYFPHAWLAMHTYDSFDIICREKEAASVDRLADDCMQGPWTVRGQTRPFLSDGKIGRHWSDV